MTDAEFHRALIIVLLAGIAIMGIGGVTLYFVFRAFGGATAGRPAHLALIAGLIAFILACCLLIYHFA